MIDLDEFRASIHKRGIAMGNRYVVRIFGTENMNFTLTPRELALCTSVNLPSINFNTFMYRNLSPTLRIPHEVIFDGLSLEFMCFEDGYPYKKFLKWQTAMYSDGMRMQDFKYYAEGKNILVQELNRKNQVIEEFKYMNCYPTTLSKSLSSENRSTPEKFSVSFSFEYVNK